MAVGPLLVSEKALVGRVVLVNKKLIWEIKANTSKRIPLAWRLKNVNGAIAVMLNP